MIGFITTIVIGIVAGYIAEKVMQRDHGIFKNLVVGVIGAMLGGFVAGIIGLDASGLIAQLVVATLGAILFLFIYDRFKAGKSGNSDKQS